MQAAAEAGAKWAITPELCIPGYLFLDRIGTDWILPQPDDWMLRFCRQVKELEITVFLSHPERDPVSGRMYNTVFVIDSSGRIAGKHRKVKALGGAERWSTGGWKINPIECDGIKAGVLICADGYKNDIAEVLKEKGAQVLVSPVSWGPGGCGPDGEWEARSADTGLPIMVCNRSGLEHGEMDYSRRRKRGGPAGSKIVGGYLRTFRRADLRLGHGHHAPCLGGLPADLPGLRNYLKSPFALRGKVRMGVDPAG